MKPAGSGGGGPETLCDGMAALALNTGLETSEEVLGAFGAGAFDASLAVVVEPVAGGTGI